MADWPSAPPAAHGIIQLEGGRCGSEAGAWLLSEAALFFVSVPAMTDKPRSTDEFRAAAMPSFHRIDLPPSSNLMLRQLAVSETSGALLAVVGQDHDGGWQLAWVDCPSPAACKVTAREAFPHGAVKDLTVGGGSLFIATAAALYRADTTLRKLEPAPIMRGIMRSVEAEGERLAVATELEMAYSEDGGKSFLPHMGRYPVVGTLLDGPAQDMVYAGESLWIATKPAISVVTANAYTRIGATDGLPYNNTQTIRFGAGRVWMGSDKGVVVRDLASDSWQYLYGPRWHPGGAVRAIAAVPGPATAAGSSSGVVVLGTDAGLSVIWVDDTFTLERKAEWYAPVMKRHDRFGLLSDCTLTTPGDRGSCYKHDSDNDGLWTTLNVAGESFRYAVQGTAEAKASAWRHFEGLLLLNNVTGIKGLMARSVVPLNWSNGPRWPNHDPPSQKGGRPCNWVNSSTDPELAWKCDTSNDEVVGHYFAYLTVAELLAETAEATRTNTPAASLR